jgi:nitrogen regulatory protein PII
VENKYYAQNIGEVKELIVKGGSEEMTLVQINGTGNNNTGLSLTNQTTTKG